MAQGHLTVAMIVIVMIIAPASVFLAVRHCSSDITADTTFPQVSNSTTAIVKPDLPQISVGMVLRQQENGADETLRFHTSTWLNAYADRMVLAPSSTTSMYNDTRLAVVSNACRLCEAHPMGPVRGLSCRRWTLLREMHRQQPDADFFIVMSDDVFGNMTALSDRLTAYSPTRDLYAGYAAKTVEWPPLPQARMDNQLEAWGLTTLLNMSKAWQAIPHIAGGPGYIFSRHTVSRLLPAFEQLGAYNTCLTRDDIWLGLVVGRYLGLRPTNIWGFEQARFVYNLFSDEVKPCEVGAVGPVTHFFRMYPDDPLRCEDLLLIHVGSACTATECPLDDLRKQLAIICGAGHRNLMFQKGELTLVTAGIKPIETEGRWNNKDVTWIPCQCTTVECCEMYPYMCA